MDDESGESMEPMEEEPNKCDFFIRIIFLDILYTK